MARIQPGTSSFAKLVQGAWLPVALLAALGGCSSSVPATQTPPAVPQRAEPSLDEDGEGLLAALLSEDPGDYHRWRTRLWRMGSLSWTVGGEPLGDRPQSMETAGQLELAQALDVVVIDEQGPRILLPLDRLDRLGRLGQSSEGEPPAWSALRLVAVPSAGDLVMGLRRELTPTPWLTLAAGLAVRPVDGDGEELLVRWSDSSCGFDLDLTIDRADFGPLYEPGPSGSPDAGGGSEFDLAPGTAVFAGAGDPNALFVIEEESAGGAALTLGREVQVVGKPESGRQAIELRCAGVTVRAWVPRKAVRPSTARYSRAEPEVRPSSSCRSNLEPGVTAMLVPEATPLFEARQGAEATLIGATVEAVELPVHTGADGWLESCVPSPWGDLRFRFQPR